MVRKDSVDGKPKSSPVERSLKIGKRYKKEYDRLLQSRAVKVWLKSRALMGKKYAVYDKQFPDLSQEDLKSLRTGAPTRKERALGAFDSNWRHLIADISDSNGSSYYEKAPFSAGIITDEYMYNYYKDALDFHYLNKDNYKEEIEEGDFRFVLFVSCWRGLGDGQDYNSPGKRKVIEEIFRFAKQKGIKTIFQSIEDPTSYDMFLDIAKEADYIFTSDRNMVERYKADTDNEDVHVADYGINPSFHNPIGLFSCKGKRLNYLDSSVLFSGSWYGTYPQRCKDTSMLFEGVLKEAFRNLIIVDRNSNLPANLKKDYEFPAVFEDCITDAIDHRDLQKVHRLFRYSICVNTVKDSESMCAMRVYEFQALGSLMFSNYALAISSRFPSLFMILEGREVKNIVDGYTDRELVNMQIGGIRRMYSRCTVYDRLNEMFEYVGEAFRFEKRRVLIVCEGASLVELQKAFDEDNSVTVIDKKGGDSVASLAAEFDYLLYADEAFVRQERFLEDAVNAFKFTDVDYVSCTDEVTSRSYNYVSGTAERHNTLFALAKVDVDRLQDSGYLSQLGGFEIVCERWGRTTKADKTLAVIVPIHNNGRYLVDRCFQSLLRSSIFDDMMIYLVDDGSTDPGTLKTIKWLEDHYDNVKTYRFSDTGSGSASRPRNKGVELSVEPYVTYLDPDNEAINDGYAVLLDKLKGSEADFAVGTILKVAAPSYEPMVLTPSYREGLSSDPRNELIRTNFLGQSVQAAVLRREFLEASQIQNVERAVGEDTLFYYEMMLNARAFIFVNLPIHVYYAERAGSAVNDIHKPFFDKSLLLEKEQVKRLREKGVLDIYKKNRLQGFVDGWYREKLKLVADEDERLACDRVVEEIVLLYN
ncbi:glycosyltransferase family 2 protein [Adlercreutzia caecimuris]|uniref:glycosyltransferase family 2 protein n=1 Tax=Adlercreutzia caecimuris TaxID=671266 RepID=UPI001C3CF309|nr:glycosyltransferase family 2 protein [Adlercreutzia caecimuris]